MNREQAVQILRGLAQVVVETVEEAGQQGVPTGPMYAAFMAYGVSLEMFEGLVDALVQAGRVLRRGHLLYPAAGKPQP